MTTETSRTRPNSARQSTHDIDGSLSHLVSREALAMVSSPGWGLSAFLKPSSGIYAALAPICGKPITQGLQTGKAREGISHPSRIIRARVSQFSEKH
jgi:hypothetical protein